MERVLLIPKGQEHEIYVKRLKRFEVHEKTQFHDSEKIHPTITCHFLISRLRRLKNMYEVCAHS